MFNKGQEAVAVFDQALAKGLGVGFGQRAGANPIQLSEPAGAASLEEGGGLTGLACFLCRLADALNPADQGLEKAVRRPGAPAGFARGVGELFLKVAGLAQVMGQAALPVGGMHEIVGGVIVGVQQAL